MTQQKELDIPETIKKLTTEQKVKLLSGRDFWHTAAIPEHNIPSIRVSDGPNGLRGTKFFNSVPSACFPCGTAMGALFDHDQMRQAGELMAQEALAKGVHSILGPTVNIQRSPLGGRGFESFSEDPLLSGETASDLVNGMQSKHIQATIKHFVGNDMEHERRSYNAQIPERALREIYLMPFQLAIKNANPGCIMSCYNKVNGKHVANDSRFLKDVLRDEWQWDGMVMSDWFGTYTTHEGVAAGNSLEMPGGVAIRRGAQLEDAINSRQIKMPQVDEQVEHVLKFVNRAIRSGIPENAPEGENNNESASVVLRNMAAESVVLLQNEDNILPLKKQVKTAVIGPNSQAAAYCGGGSASLNAYYLVSPLEGIANKLDSKPTNTIGVETNVSLPDVGRVLKTADGKPGFSFKCYDSPADNPDRKLADELHLSSGYMFMPDYTPNIGESSTYYIDLEGYFTPGETAEYEFGCIVNGTARVFIDDKEVIDNATHQRQGTAFMGSGTVEEKGSIQLTAGQTYKYFVRYGGARTSKLAASSTIVFGGGMQLGMRKVVSAEQEIQNAVQLAKDADQVVLCIGLNGEIESEGFDRPHMDLPAGTDDLVTRVVAANPETVVVIQSGTPVTINWADKVKGIVQAWYGGNETGNGIADVLFGDVNPSGKLPLSWPKRVEDNPAYFNYAAENGVVVYGENVYVGYRYYETVKRDVQWSFGHGLSYTQFEYGQATASIEGDKLVVTVDVTNTGDKPGKESVQVYVSQQTPSIRRPVKELKGYGKVGLTPGQSKPVKIVMDLKYATSYWDDSRDQWVMEKGHYEVLVGASSADIKSKSKVSVAETTWWSGL